MAVQGPCTPFLRSEFDFEQFWIFYRFLNLFSAPPWPGFLGLGPKYRKPRQDTVDLIDGNQIYSQIH